MKLFFVYGTLKKGHGNNRLLDRAELVGEATTVDTFTLRNCGYPYLIEGDSTGPERSVFGEVYRVDDDQTEQDLDSLEGVDYGHYMRKLIKVSMVPTEKVEEVNVYYVKGGVSGLPLCPVNDGGFYEWEGRGR